MACGLVHFTSYSPSYNATSTGNVNPGYAGKHGNFAIQHNNITIQYYMLNSARYCYGPPNESFFSTGSFLCTDVWTVVVLVLLT